MPLSVLIVDDENVFRNYISQMELWQKGSFILAGENMGPAKLEKAQKLGVQIMSEDEFLALIS